MTFWSATGRSVVVGLLASLCVVTSSPRASAEPTWLPTVDVSSGASVLNGYDLAHLSDGTLAVVWGEAINEDEGSVYFATRGRGDDAFSTPELLGEGYAVNPQIVVDTHGGVSVAWIQNVNGATVQATHLEPGPTDWSGPVIVASHSTVSFELLVDPHDTVTVLSRHVLGLADLGAQTFRVDANVRTAGEGWFGPEAVAEETTQEIDDLRAVVAADGTVTAVWTQGAGADARVHVATAPAAGAFVDEPLSGAAMGAQEPDLAVTPGGGVAVSWGQDVSPGASKEVAMLATRGPGDAWFTPAEAVGGPQDVVLDTEVVVDDARTTTLVSVGRLVDEYAVIAATRPDGDWFTSPLLASTLHGVVLTDVEVALAADGALTVVWQRGDVPDPTCAVYAAHRPARGDFTTPLELTAPDDPDTADDDVCTDDPLVAVDTAGDATVIWGAKPQGGGLHTTESRVLDVAGPQLDVSVPSAATPGSAVEMTASALDHWSGPATFAWSFGDGAMSAVAATSHVYDAAGTYQVSVTATDAVGNTSTLTRALLVGVPPTPPPPSPPAPPLDRVSPVLSKARVKPKALPATRAATLRLTSSEAATLTGIVQRSAGGRWKRAGHKLWSVVAGANTEKLYGKAAQSRLRPGTYRVRLTATDPAGNTSATTAVRFGVDRG